MDKTVGGKVFAPREVRQLAPSERATADPDMFARVEGLGRIPYANLRRPKPLMDTVTQQLPHGQVSSSSNGCTCDDDCMMQAMALTMTSCKVA